MPVLFVTNGFYRIEPCCFFGRIPSKEYTSKRTYCKAHDNTPWLYLSSYVGKLLQGNRNTYSKNHTDYTTSTLSRIASIRNWLRMSIPLAPTLILKPISRVRSVTLTYIIFMIPMPPTIREIPATLPSKIVIVDIVEFIILEISSCERILKSSSSPSVVSVASFNLCVYEESVLSDPEQVLKLLL